MKAMVLAAGLGTRLRPLTDDRPKALVQIAGRTLLEIALARLSGFGIRDVIVNVHHFADMITAYLKANNDFGMHIEISREDDVLLDTGGGLKKASWFFLANSSPADEPLVLHNVDVISTIDLASMIRFHREHNALATLAVQQRDSKRQLLFASGRGNSLELCGRRAAEGNTELVRAAANPTPLAFCGIHVISSRIFPLMNEQGIFSILTPYLRLAGMGEKIVAFPCDEYRWRDLGKLADLNQAESEAAQLIPEHT